MTSKAAAATATTAVTSIPNQNQIDIEIPECLKNFPGLHDDDNKDNIKSLPVCNRKRNECGCKGLLIIPNIKKIRMEYLKAIESDIKERGLDSTYRPTSNPAGASFIQQFIAPISEKQRKRYD